MVYSVMVPRQKIAFPLLILRVLLFCIHGDHATSTNDYIYSRCNITANYTRGSKFELNMHWVFSTLTKDAPPSGFTNATKGQGSNRVYGLVQCRGDVDQDTCMACIHNSTVAVVETYCPNATDAIIWYEKCQLRYSNTNFFAHLNVEDSGYWYWTNDKVEDPKAFNEKLGGLLKNLSSKATTEPSKFMFATGYIPYADLQTIYGLVQCTRDTSLADCNLCLDSTMSQIPSTCENAHGCEIATGSCRVRYDTELFYGTSKIPSASPPSSSPAPSTSSPSPSPLFHSSTPSSSPAPSPSSPSPSPSPLFHSSSPSSSPAPSTSSPSPSPPFHSSSPSNSPSPSNSSPSPTSHSSSPSSSPAPSTSSPSPSPPFHSSSPSNSPSPSPSNSSPSPPFHSSSPSNSPSPSPSNSSLSPLFHSSSPAPNSSPPSNGAPKTTSDKSKDSSATTVSIITVITFALTSAWLLMMPSWL